MEKLFVYGTLRRGMHNHSMIKDKNIDIRRGHVRGKLYVNGLPYFKRHGNDLIVGDLIYFHDVDDFGKELAFIDRLEGHPNSYRREKIEVQLAGETTDAWIYVYQGVIPHNDTTRDWIKYIKGVQ